MDHTRANRDTEDKMIKLGTPTIKQKSIQQIKPIEKEWSTKKTFQKYPIINLGMNLTLNRLEVIDKAINFVR